MRRGCQPITTRMGWVHWWITVRLHEALGYRTPVEVEAAYSLDQDSASVASGLRDETPGRFTGPTRLGHPGRAAVRDHYPWIERTYYRRR